MVEASSNLLIQGTSSFDIPDTMDREWKGFVVRVADRDPEDENPVEDCWVVIKVTTPSDGNGNSETAVYGSVD